MDKPPDSVIEVARQMAVLSPCQKSKRGVVIYHPDPPKPYEQNFIAGDGYNGHPSNPFARCDGSEACRRDCAKLCVHAEARALLYARDWCNDRFHERYIPDAKIPNYMMPKLVMVHVKVVDTIVVAGGGPSCWQCSRDILEAGIAGVWLYEQPIDRSAFPAWRFYTAIDFHRATLKACGIGQGIGWWRDPSAPEILVDERPMCKVCGAVPNADGERVHGKGCYQVSPDGGGSDWPE